MRAVVNVNGRLCDGQDATVSVFDHGFLFGDGVYEVVRTHGRQPFLFEAHQKRLRESAARISLPVPVSDDEFLARIRSTVEALPGTGEAYVRILLTRGVGEFTYDPAACTTPTLVIIAMLLVTPPAAVYEHGVKVAMVDVVRNHPESVDPRIKSNNLLNNALAMHAALGRGGFEALMRNYRGEIVECSQSNFFVVRGGVVLTPPLTAGLLAGITRAFVFQLGRETGIPVHEQTLFERDVQDADEAFLTSTTKDIVPVVRVDDLVIGYGKPGVVTHRLMEAFREHTAKLLAATTG